MTAKKGVFYGVGIGPGDPELLTLKAVRILEGCEVIAAPRTKGEATLALEIAGKAVDLSGKEILPLEFTMDRDPEVRMAAYRAAAEQLIYTAADRSQSEQCNANTFLFCHFSQPLAVL